MEINMSDNHGKVPQMTPKTLIVCIIVVIAFGSFLFFVKGDLSGKLCACIVCPGLIIYMIYAYFKEQRADKEALVKNKNILDGSYFNSSKWNEQYTVYINKHPFEKPKYSNMKQDLLARFRRREYFVNMLFIMFLMLCSFCCVIIGKYFVGVAGILLFGIFFCWELALYIGMPVRKWLKGDINYKELEASYLKSKILTYKKSGLALGTSHIHAYTENKVYAIDYRIVEGISRKIVRLKKYEDNIYSSEDYQHFAVIHVCLPQNEEIYDVEIELNEFQVQMVIDNLPLFKYGEKITENMIVERKEENELV